MRAKRKKISTKLDLTPVMDVIFIFIFFLLMSAQFINIHQIGTDAPIVTEVDPSDNKDPLNLTLIVTKEMVTIQTGLNEKIEGKFNFEELEKLNEKLIDIKRNHPSEKTAILKPNSKVHYQDIVKIIDYTKEVRAKGILVTSTDAKGTKTTSNKLFDQIVFETQD